MNFFLLYNNRGRLFCCSCFEWDNVLLYVCFFSFCFARRSTRPRPYRRCRRRDAALCGTHVSACRAARGRATATAASAGASLRCCIAPTAPSIRSPPTLPCSIVSAAPPTRPSSNPLSLNFTSTTNNNSTANKRPQQAKATKITFTPYMCSFGCLPHTYCVVFACCDITSTVNYLPLTVHRFSMFLNVF